MNEIQNELFIIAILNIEMQTMKKLNNHEVIRNPKAVLEIINSSIELIKTLSEAVNKK